MLEDTPQPLSLSFLLGATGTDAPLVVRASSSAGGRFEFGAAASSVGAGVAVNAAGVLNVTGSRSAVSTALSGMRFVPGADYNGATTLRFEVWRTDVPLVNQGTKGTGVR
jgi:hypothetical protein